MDPNDNRATWGSSLFPFRKTQRDSLLSLIFPWVPKPPPPIHQPLLSLATAAASVSLPPRIATSTNLPVADRQPKQPPKQPFQEPEKEQSEEETESKNEFKDVNAVAAVALVPSALKSYALSDSLASSTPKQPSAATGQPDTPKTKSWSKQQPSIHKTQPTQLPAQRATETQKTNKPVHAVGCFAVPGSASTAPKRSTLTPQEQLPPSKRVHSVKRPDSRQKPTRSNDQQAQQTPTTNQQQLPATTNRQLSAAKNKQQPMSQKTSAPHDQSPKSASTAKSIPKPKQVAQQQSEQNSRKQNTSKSPRPATNPSTRTKPDLNQQCQSASNQATPAQTPKPPQTVKQQQTAPSKQQSSSSKSKTQNNQAASNKPGSDKYANPPSSQRSMPTATQKTYAAKQSPPTHLQISQNIPFEPSIQLPKETHLPPGSISKSSSFSFTPSVPDQLQFAAQASQKQETSNQPVSNTLLQMSRLPAKLSSRIIKVPSRRFVPSNPSSAPQSKTASNPPPISEQKTSSEPPPVPQNNTPSNQTSRLTAVKFAQNTQASNTNSPDAPAPFVLGVSPLPPAPRPPPLPPRPDERIPANAAAKTFIPYNPFQKRSKSPTKNSHLQNVATSAVAVPSIPIVPGSKAYVSDAAKAAEPHSAPQLACPSALHHRTSVKLPIPASAQPIVHGKNCKCKPNINTCNVQSAPKQPTNPTQPPRTAPENEKATTDKEDKEAQQEQPRRRLRRHLRIQRYIEALLMGQYVCFSCEYDLCFRITPPSPSKPSSRSKETSAPKPSPVIPRQQLPIQEPPPLPQQPQLKQDLPPQLTKKQQKKLAKQQARLKQQQPQQPPMQEQPQQQIQQCPQHPQVPKQLPPVLLDLDVD